MGLPWVHLPAGHAHTPPPTPGEASINRIKENTFLSTEKMSKPWPEHRRTERNRFYFNRNTWLHVSDANRWKPGLCLHHRQTFSGLISHGILLSEKLQILFWPIDSASEDEPSYSHWPRRLTNPSTSSTSFSLTGKKSQMLGIKNRFFSENKELLF